MIKKLVDLFPRYRESYGEEEQGKTIHEINATVETDELETVEVIGELYIDNDTRKSELVIMTATELKSGDEPAFGPEDVENFLENNQLFNDLVKTLQEDE